MALIIPNTQTSAAIATATYSTGSATQIYTLMCWFKITAAGAGSYMDLVAIENNIYMQIITNTLQIDYGTFDDDHLGTVLTAGRWYHATMIVIPTSTTSRQIYGYLNGNLDVSLIDGDTFSTSAGISIGNSINVPGTSHYVNPLNGSIEDVRIWTRQLTLSEIQDEIRSIVPVHKQGMLVWAPFNDNMTEDKSGHGYIFTAGASVTLGAGRPNRTWLGRGVNFIK